MLYRRKLELEVEEIRPDMQTVRDACKDLRGSERFKVVLQVCRIPFQQEGKYSLHSKGCACRRKRAQWIDLPG